jgi:hypothetical protein
VTDGYDITFLAAPSKTASKTTDESKIEGDYTEYNLEQTDLPKGATVKAFLCKSLASMTPLADAKQK